MVGMMMKDISQTTIKSKDDSCFKHEKKQTTVTEKRRRRKQMMRRMIFGGISCSFRLFSRCAFFSLPDLVAMLSTCCSRLITCLPSLLSSFFLKEGDKSYVVSLSKVI